MEHGILARQLLAVVLLGEGHVQVLLLADVHTHHLLFKAGDELAGAQGQGLVLRGAALKGHAVHRAHVVELHGVAILQGAFHVDLTGNLLAVLLNAGINVRVGDGLLGHVHGQALVVAQGHIGRHTLRS